MKCKECEKELTQIEGKRKKEFCDSTCRSNFWQKAKRKENTPVLVFKKTEVKKKAALKAKEIKYAEITAATFDEDPIKNTNDEIPNWKRNLENYKQSKNKKP